MAQLGIWTLPLVKSTMDRLRKLRKRKLPLSTPTTMGPWKNYLPWVGEGYTSGEAYVPNENVFNINLESAKRHQSGHINPEGEPLQPDEQEPLQPDEHEPLQAVEDEPLQPDEHEPLQPDEHEPLQPDNEDREPENPENEDDGGDPDDVS